MLKQAISSLGRWIGAFGPSASPARGSEERRVWVRYSCNVEASCLLAGDKEPVRLSARVQDISHGGIQLVMGQEFQVGGMLSIDLPGLSEFEPVTVLAYVVRVTRIGDEEWSLGCSFALELSDDDLRPFGARRRRASRDDQRLWERFPCPVTATVQSVSAGDAESWPAEVTDISPTGVGLLVTQSMTVGKLLSVTLRGKDASRTLIMLASVVRSSKKSADKWSLGCTFIRELAEVEIQGLLAPALAEVV
jgi:hypothetical protein